MADPLTGQVTRSAAEVYEEFFVPALFLEWAPRVADAAQLAPGKKILDVACGTGVLAREAARRVQPGGAVIGLDRNDGMLAVARRKAPSIDWQMGMASRAGGTQPKMYSDAEIARALADLFQEAGIPVAQRDGRLGPAGRANRPSRLLGLRRYRWLASDAGVAPRSRGEGEVSRLES